MINRFSHLILLLLFVSSCDQKTVVKKPIPLSDIDEFKSFKIDIKAPKTKLTDLVASVEIARLEETPESLLSRVQYIFQHDDNLLFYNRGIGDIFIFDETGKFKRKINRTGNGPEEYKQITDFWLEGDTIALFTRSTNRVMKYSFQGDFIESKRLPFQIDHMRSYGDGYVFGTNFTPIQDSIRYQWGIWDKGLEPTHYFLPYGQSSINKMDVNYSNNTVHMYQNDRFLLRMHGDSVYLLRNNQLMPIVHLDYGKDWFWTGRGTADGKDFDAVENSGQVWENTINIGKQSIYLKSVVAYDSWEHFLINRLDEKVIHIDMIRNSEELFTLYTLLWQEDRLLCSMPSSEVAEFINQVGVENIEYKQGTSLDIIESSENPVLMWITFNNDD